MRPRELVLSTDNIHKAKEIQDILKELPIDVLSKKDLGIEDLHITEDGQTLEENAIKKARALAGRVDGMVMADDSGLFVDYLDGGNAPGIHSARYAGPDATDEDNNDKLLRELKGVPLEQRGARFRAVIALILEDGEVLTVDGECSGTIGFEPRGDGGFGYDPIFIVDGYDKTFAELGDDIKNTRSHRARALNRLKDAIDNIIKDG
ncbi:MAG: RdgB/HAM1 family non-canonical purine NTP pyrophosphatase [Tissierellia bacterium]|nr:RdgB/HAM1 family non-canonical purine NTP pyrophosphatase [Tissierellia bacterium]